MKLMMLLNESTVRDEVIAHEVDKCLDKIAKVSGLGDDYDAIMLSEAIINYLNRKHIRYKNTMNRHGGRK